MSTYVNGKRTPTMTIIRKASVCKLDGVVFKDKFNGRSRIPFNKNLIFKVVFSGEIDLVSFEDGVAEFETKRIKHMRKPSFMELIKSWFKPIKMKDPYYCDEKINELSELPSIDEALTPEEKDRAYSFFDEDKSRIEQMMLETTTAVHPTGSDRLDPRLWLPAHWKWFLNKLKEKGYEQEK